MGATVAQAFHAPEKLDEMLKLAEDEHGEEDGKPRAKVTAWWKAGGIKAIEGDAADPDEPGNE